jgi:hypothetical protein
MQHLPMISIKSHPHLSSHYTIQHSFLDCDLFEAMSLSTMPFIFNRHLIAVGILAGVGGTSSALV